MSELLDIGPITRRKFAASKARRQSMVAYQVGHTWSGFIVRAQHGRCAGCGHPLPNERRRKLNARSGDYPTLDHLIPKHVGGSEHPTNKVAMHRKCNGLKGGRMPTGCEIIWGEVVKSAFEKIGYPTW